MLRECLQCARYSMGARKYPLQPMEVLYPFEKVALDTGHVTMASGQKEYFLVAVDLFTKGIKVKAVQRKNGEDYIGSGAALR
ncbi:Ectonucleotide pyrophosphatase/phosphodiesterase member 7 [Entomophthora muscae]|uniref:Ectonucleotide pyrophosphatase/phosphodiesterase member 7 n=1 Tax=Entomophthora muscae TaxID=34485 RepID=A0ACC2UMC2_9FUNG|nr:Ectonucleotide pyrophosphatase/phosphodiesterase member 7 [Entomophthora muscae]